MYPEHIFQQWLMVYLKLYIFQVDFHLDAVTRPQSLLVSIHWTKEYCKVFFFVMQVSTNGYFSFGEAAAYNNPQLFSPSSPSAYIVAPFWANNDISNRVGNITYEVHTAETSPSYMMLVSSFISQQKQVKFSGNWMLVAYWNDVPQFGGSLSAVSSNSPSIILPHLAIFLCIHTD